MPPRRQKTANVSRRGLIERAVLRPQETAVNVVIPEKVLYRVLSPTVYNGVKYEASSVIWDIDAVTASGWERSGLIERL